MDKNTLNESPITTNNVAGNSVTPAATIRHFY